MSQGRVEARRREPGYDRRRESAYSRPVAAGEMERRSERAYARPVAAAEVEGRLESAYERRSEPAYERPVADGGVPTRRTIVIRGQVADRAYPARRPSRTVQERALARPDRVAMWAVMLGLLLVVVAATSGHA